MKDYLATGRKWLRRIRAGLAGMALAGLANVAGANVTVCVEAGEMLSLRVGFETRLENAVVVSDSGGRRIVGFNNFFGRGAGGEWTQGAGSWRTQRLAERRCFHIAGQHKAGTANPALSWLPSTCRVDGQSIGFEDGENMNYRDARVDILSGRIDRIEPPCQPARSGRLDDAMEERQQMQYLKRAKPPATASAPSPTIASVLPPAAMAREEIRIEARRPTAAKNGVAGDSRRPAGSAGGSPGVALSFKLPEFPFPPPDPSARLRIPRELLSGDAAAPTFGSVATRMEDALSSNGYSELSYFAVPAGFTLVTQLERINPDATPAAEQRWSIAVEPVSLKSFSLEAYVRALLQKDAGFFRVIVFVFSAEPFTASGKKVPVDEAMKWIDRGANTLPHDVALRPYGEDMVCTALVYEFEIHTHGADAQLRKPSPHDGTEHLRASGILHSLGE